MVRRERALRACKARFEGKALDWRSRDCVRLAAHAMRSLGVATPLLKGLSYRSELAAAKALRDLGYADLVEAMDATNLVRVAPAMTWPGDIVAGPGRDSGPFRFSLSVVHSAGARRTLAFGPDGVCGVGSPDLTLPHVAWRVAPLTGGVAHG